MIRLIRRLETQDTEPAQLSGTLALTYDERKRGRLKTQTTEGQPAGLFLDRGKTLCDGDILQAEDGACYQVQAAPEAVIEAHTSDWLAFARICYHLGNRHLPLQIDSLRLRFQPDHVLEDLVQLYGLQTRRVEQPFQPESGAYGAHGGHGHGHENSHAHEDAPFHDNRLRPPAPRASEGPLDVIMLDI